MSWLQIEVSTVPDDLAELETALEDNGALAITLLSNADEAVLEPRPGETPLWHAVRLKALFPLDTDVAALRELLSPYDQVDIDLVGEVDWQARAGQYAVNEVFGERLWLLPKDQRDEFADPPAAGEPVRLFLAPGLAFGSGGHPTTRLCLAWLAEATMYGSRVLDFGCGSGVLGIAAGLLGASVVAVDHDPQAIVATRENAAYNGLAARDLQTLDLAQWAAAEHRDTFDVVVANILATPLMDLAEDFETVARPGAHIVLSGILNTQADDVRAAYPRTIFDMPISDGEWALLVGTLEAR